jgi:hypothetical protein
MKCSILLPFSPGSCLCSCASNQGRRKLFLRVTVRYFLFFPPYTLTTQSVVVGGKACDEGAWGGWGRGQGKPGRGKGKGKGKDKDSGAGVGSTYANPGRPKTFQPTQQDRKQTGNIAEYFRRSDTTPQPVAPVFASAQMRGGLEGVT